MISILARRKCLIDDFKKIEKEMRKIINKDIHLKRVKSQSMKQLRGQKRSDSHIK